ncbi:surface-adhesin E family protein [Sphingopyxis indica]|uniref:surface-adhesin E family protein n=1 Tax=Sphingopyxis indica TaxID=436663 RepID=UPI001131D010|nr:surface-adhesin E family protein [Sphingopyxis indica]
MANDGDWFWPLAGAALLAWFAYEKWWKEDAPPSPAIASNSIPPPIKLSAADAARDPNPLPPPRWMHITEIENGTVWRLDTTSIRGPRNQRVAWVKEDHSKDQTVAHRSTMVLYSFDCDTTGYRTLSLKEYSKDGKVIRGLDYDEPDQRYAPPDTNIGAVIEQACNSRFDKPPSADATPIQPPVTTNR